MRAPSLSHCANGYAARVVSGWMTRIASCLASLTSADDDADTRTSTPPREPMMNKQRRSLKTPGAGVSHNISLPKFSFTASERPKAEKGTKLDLATVV